MRYLIDNNLPPRLANALHALVEDDGDEVLALRDKFDPSVNDEDWISALDTEGDWVIVSADRFRRRSRRNVVERELLRRSNLIVYLLDYRWSRLLLWEKCWRLVRWWPTIRETARSISPGVGYSVPPNYPAHKRGKLETLWARRPRN